MKSLSELATDYRSQAAQDFFGVAKCLLRTSSPREAHQLAEHMRASERTRAILKAAVSAGTMTDPSTAVIADLQIASNGFVGSLASIGVFDRLLADGAMRRIPLEQPGIRIASTALIGSSPAEGAAKPITRFSIASEALTRTKSDCIVVVSNELANSMSSGAQSLIGNELRKGVVAATDTVFLAGITAGVTPIAGVGDVFNDIANLLQAIDSDASSRFYLITDPDGAKRLAAAGSTLGGRLHPDMTPSGGSVCGIPVLVSDQIVPSGSPTPQAVVLVDASGIAGDSEVVALDTTQHASLDMVDSSLMSSGGFGSPSAPVATTMVSMFQTNSKALRASRFFGFRKLRSDSVQMLSGTNW